MTDYKIVVIGSGGVGKSALTIQFMQSTFVDKYDPTIEDQYHRQVEVDGVAIMLDILDTAGQEEYSAMREEFMAKGNGFLMVYSVTDDGSYQDCHKLYQSLLKSKDVEAETHRLPIVLCANKCDVEEPSRLVTKEQGEELSKTFGPLCKYFETSAKERINVDQVFEALVRLINKAENKEVLDAPPEAQADTSNNNSTDSNQPAASNSSEGKQPSDSKKPKKKKALCSML